MTKINKALDYNKLLEAQLQGKLLKKVLKFPLMAQIKYDGNYTVTEVRDGHVKHFTSGGLTYRHTDAGADVFREVTNGYYIGERIARSGKLGQRRYCALTGSKSDQKSSNHTYQIFDYLTIDEYERGSSTTPYEHRYLELMGNLPHSIVNFRIIENSVQLDNYLKEVVKDGYEGLMLIQPSYKWKDTKSRTVDLCKLKSRPTADLLCVDTTEGLGKYAGMIGSLVLKDSLGRIVQVGSGLNDYNRKEDPSEFIGKVIEIEYEQIIGTYIQPTFLCVRDKDKEDID